jgi:hypothetical protein
VEVGRATGAVVELVEFAGDPTGRTGSSEVLSSLSTILGLIGVAA